jgi:hypothetical protein
MSAFAGIRASYVAVKALLTLRQILRSSFGTHLRDCPYSGVKPAGHDHSSQPPYHKCSSADLDAASASPSHDHCGSSPAASSGVLF